MSRKSKDLEKKTQEYRELFQAEILHEILKEVQNEILKEKQKLRKEIKK